MKNTISCRKGGSFVKKRFVILAAVLLSLLFASGCGLREEIRRQLDPIYDMQQDSLNMPRPVADSLMYLN